MTARPSLHAQLQNPLTKARDTHDRSRLAVAFPLLHSESESGSLALRCYLDSRPEKFFDRHTYKTQLAWLQRRKTTSGQQLTGYLSSITHDTDSALRFLREINAESWHDQQYRTTTDTIERIRFVDRHVHPTYLRLAEGVLGPLIKPVAYFSRLDRGKSPDGLTLRAVMEEIKRYVPDSYTRAYRTTVRNGIAHGGITFSDDDITYRDSRGNRETVRIEDFMRLFDDLLDECNALALALKVFLLGSRTPDDVLPREFLIEQLREETLTPWWEVVGCIESESIRGSQLNVYARSNSRDHRKLQWSVVQSGIFAEFLAPGYDRYFFSLRDRKAWPGWAAFDGTRLRALRKADAHSFAEYAGVIESAMFSARKSIRPAFFGVVDTLIQSIKLQIPVAMRQIREHLQTPSIVCRDARIHRNSWGAVLNAEAVLEDLERGSDPFRTVRRLRRRILRSAIRYVRSEARFSGCAYLPIAFAQISVFRRDYRRRRLPNFRLGEDLVCTVRFQRMRRIKSPDIIGSTVEKTGKWRIAWNSAWLRGQRTT